MPKIDFQHVDGVLLLNKPKGLSSNKALQKTKYLFKAKKAGHTGALDPLATGVLPICFGEATKFSQYLLDASKTYEVTAQLGAESTTGDAEGEIINHQPVAVTQLLLQQALEKFRGETQQVPPMYSALKYQGQPLYKLARKGKSIVREPRDITIHELTLLDFDGTCFRAKVSCSKGTYIRTLVEDIGRVLNCGAYVTALHRIEVGQFTIANAYDLEQLQQSDIPYKQLLLPIDCCVADYPKIQLTLEQTMDIQHGRKVMLKASECFDRVRLYSNEQQFLGLGSIDDSQCLKPQRLLRFQPVE